MKKISLFCLILAGLLFVQMLPVGAVSTSTSQGADTLDAMVPLTATQLEGTSAQAAILYELGSNTMVYGWMSRLTLRV